MIVRVLGRYELIERLGRGGMGEVWRARDPALRRDVAVKVLRHDDGDGQGTLRDEFVQRFLREARSAASLKHPNIVAIHDVGVDAEPYIVMEYVEGTPLRGFIGKTDVPVALRLAWLVEIAEALAAAHDMGLVHRDVKPDNVMITKDGHAKVLDFGIAKAIGEEEKAPSSAREAPESFRTQHGRLVGTPKYMAPEQMTGAPIDARVDQWAWACVAYELLLGSMPDRDEAALPISLTLPDVPFDVAAAIVRARAHDPAKRFPTMRAVADAIATTTAPDQPLATVNVAPKDPDAPTTTGAIRNNVRTNVALVALASFAIAGATVLAIARTKKPASPTAEQPACEFSPLSPLVLGSKRFVVRGAAIGDSVLASLIRVEPDGTRTEELVTVTSEAATMREPPPMNVPDEGGPNWAFPLAMPGGSHHYLFYEQGTRGGLIAGRLMTNDDLTDMMRIPRFIDDDTNFNANFIVPVMAPSHKAVFVVAGTERPKMGDIRSAIRIYDDRADGTSLFRGDDMSVPRDLSAIADHERIAYTFMLANKIYAGVIAPNVVEPFVVGPSSGGSAIALQGSEIHLVWSDAGHLHHGVVSIGDGGAGHTDTPLEAASDGSTPALVIDNGKTRLAWRDGTRIWYGEGPTVEAASRHASAFAETSASNGPWLAPTSKGALLAWIAGATNEVRRATVTCK